MTTVRWHMKEQEILRSIVGANEHSSVIVDLKPKVKGNVSLYEIKDAWGFSYEGWTPLLLCLETLFVDRQEKEPDKSKERFDATTCKRERVFEVLYLQGGITSKSWKWGMVGFVNGALLWADALTYFLEVLNKRNVG